MGGGGEALPHVTNKDLAIEWKIAGAGISAEAPALVEPPQDKGDDTDSAEFYSVPDEWRSQPSKPKPGTGKGKKGKEVKSTNSGRGKGGTVKTPAVNEAQARGWLRRIARECPDFNGPKGCQGGKTCPKELLRMCTNCGGWGHGAHHCKQE